MPRVTISLLAALVLFIGSEPACAGGAAEVRIFTNTDEPGWVGERRDINLEMWTEDLSFSGQSWLLPDVPGAFLMQMDSGSIKLSESRQGKSWQGLRYTLSLFPQRAGRIEIPPFEVRFSTREGYMDAPVEHRLLTEPLTVETRQPEGAQPGAPLVSTTRFQLDADWDPAPKDGAVSLKTGDALVLTVRRGAQDLPGMVFASLPEWSADGLGIYVDRPEVRDRAERGSLSGERSDRVTVVCERPGSFRLPELRFQWWNPERQELHEEVIPALSIEVSENPAWSTQAAASKTDGGFRFDWRYVRVLLAVFVLAWPLLWLAKRLWGWLKTELRARRLVPLNPR